MNSKKSIAMLAAIGLAVTAAVTTLENLVSESGNKAKRLPDTQYAIGEVVSKYAVAPSLSSNLFGYNVPRIVPVFAESNLSVRFFDTNNHVNVNVIFNDSSTFSKFSVGDKVKLIYSVNQRPVQDDNGKVSHYAVVGYKPISLSKP